jgi:phospholipid/cholesterol/gamma-HCH transport system substrate-binding protein
VKRSRWVKAIGVVVVGALALTGCSSFNGIYDLPLPGGADVGKRPYTIKAQFQDVLDLTPQAGVKVNEVPIGRVENIGLTPDGWHAEVTMELNSDVKLPANALANVKQSSLLGEKYIELSSPQNDEVKGPLTNGAVIPLERTNRSVEVEEVLGALSMLLNGGGVDQLNTITKELNNATEGHEPDIKNLLDGANQLVSNLDAQSANITHALDGLNRLSSTLNGQKAQIGNAIDNLGPGIGVLEQQRGQLVTMLQALQNLSGIATETITKSKADVVADLKALQPTLQKLGQAGADLPKALEVLLTYPFNDASVDAVKGDYFNLFAKIDLNLGDIAQNMGRSRQNPLQDLLPSGLTGGNGAPPLPLPGQKAQSSPTGGSGGGKPQGGLAGLLSALSGGGS